MKKLSRGFIKWIYPILIGVSLSADFTGQQAKKLFPEAFGQGDDTLSSAWKDVGRYIRQALGQ